MAIERCAFCKKKLDGKDRCQNKSCVDYKRTQILETEETKGKENDLSTMA